MTNEERKTRATIWHGIHSFIDGCDSISQQQCGDGKCPYEDICKLLNTNVFTNKKRRSAIPKRKTIKTDDGEAYLYQEEYYAPYLYAIPQTRPVYNPTYGDNIKCAACGHAYADHFDSYENNEPRGCKHCGCHEFKETRP